jgi:hypothetical protein
MPTDDLDAADRELVQERTADRDQAVALFNHAWSLLDLPERTPAEDFDLIHATHASRWHWGRAGGPQEWAIGEWQCSRAYAVLGRSEPALVHARRCLVLCEEHSLEGFIVACAHEALSRALYVAGDPDAARAERDAAVRLTAALDDPDDRAVLERDLATLPPL